MNIDIFLISVKSDEEKYFYEVKRTDLAYEMLKDKSTANAAQIKALRDYHRDLLETCRRSIAAYTASLIMP